MKTRGFSSSTEAEDRGEHCGSTVLSTLFCAALDHARVNNYMV